MKFTKALFLSLFVVLLFSCSEEKSPSQVYVEYNSKVIAGISYVDEKEYYSKRKKREVESQMPKYMKSMNKSREEVIKVYQGFSQGLAICKEILLVSEVIKNDKASLEFSQKDICGNETTTTGTQSIKMVKEGGWKIDDVLLSI